MDETKDFCESGTTGDAPAELPSAARHAGRAMHKIGGRPRPWHRPFGDDDVDGSWGGEAWYPSGTNSRHDRPADAHHDAVHHVDCDAAA